MHYIWREIREKTHHITYIETEDMVNILDYECKITNYLRFFGKKFGGMKKRS